MQLISTVFVALVCLAIGIYTGSFGWWVWRKQNRLGAVGVFILATASVVVPMVLWVLNLNPGKIIP